MHLSKVRVGVVHSTDHVMHGVNSSNMSHSNVVDSSNMVDSGHGSVVYTSYMIDSMVDSRDNVVVIDTGVDRVDSSYSSNSRVGGVDTSHISHGKPSIHLSHGVRLGLRLSLTLAVHYIWVVGMRVDSRVGGVDTSYMMDTRDMSVIHSSYSVPNSSVVDQYGICFSLSMDGNSAQEDQDYGSHGALNSRDSQVRTVPM